MSWLTIINIHRLLLTCIPGLQPRTSPKIKMATPTSQRPVSSRTSVRFWSFGGFLNIEILDIYILSIYILCAYMYMCTYLIDQLVVSSVSSFVGNSWLVTFFTWWLDWLFPHGSPIVVERFNIRIIPRGV